MILYFVILGVNMKLWRKFNKEDLISFLDFLASWAFPLLSTCFPHCQTFHFMYNITALVQWSSCFLFHLGNHSLSCPFKSHFCFNSPSTLLLFPSSTFSTFLRWSLNRSPPPASKFPVRFHVPFRLDTALKSKRQTLFQFFVQQTFMTIICTPINLCQPFF